MKPESLINTEKQALTIEEMLLLVKLTMMESQGVELPQEQLNESFIYRVLSKRLAHFKIPVSQQLIAFISCMIGSPGKAVMWAYTLNELYKEAKETVTIKTITFNGFGDGFPTEEEYKRIWDAQKIKAESNNSDNAMDYPKYWQ